MNEEGYPGLVVHGPLTAALLMDLCRREKKERLASFNFRAQAPLFDTAPFTVNGAPKEDRKAWAIWAETPAGGVAMLGEATFA
jgi:3-methylfumaryl-CoA hydratase